MANDAISIFGQKYWKIFPNCLWARISGDFMLSFNSSVQKKSKIIGFLILKLLKSLTEVFKERGFGLNFYTLWLTLKNFRFQSAKSGKLSVFAKWRANIFESYEHFRFKPEIATVDRLWSSRWAQIFLIKLHFLFLIILKFFEMRRFSVFLHFWHLITVWLSFDFLVR